MRSKDWLGGKRACRRPLFGVFGGVEGQKFSTVYCKCPPCNCLSGSPVLRLSELKHHDPRTSSAKFHVQIDCSLYEDEKLVRIATVLNWLPWAEMKNRRVFGLTAECALSLRHGSTRPGLPRLRASGIAGSRIAAVGFKGMLTLNSCNVIKHR